MTQYDAGPGDWSDREWEDPDRKRQPHAKRRRVALPPWALLAILGVVVILVCVGLVFLVRSCRSEDDEGTPTATTAPDVVPSVTRSPGATIPADATATVTLPTVSTEVVPPPDTEIRPGVTVVVQGTGGLGLRVRAEPSTQGRQVASAGEGDALTVIEGPREADDHTWWKVRTGEGEEGWAAGEFLVLQTDQ
jgi:hypothetical protein